jgi:hypothetical protein
LQSTLLSETNTLFPHCFPCSFIQGSSADAGRPNNWVPLISAATIKDAIMPLLSALKTVEDIYLKVYDNKSRENINKQELQNYISQSAATASRYREQITTLQQQYNDTYATYNALVAQRSAAAAILQQVGEKFQQEIVNKLRTDSFLDGLQAILSIAATSVPNVLQISDIYSKLSRHIACLSSQHLHSSNLLSLQ